jgi:arylsulfatase A-like enzyme
VINHGGEAADPFIEGRDRKFSSTLGRTSWMRCLRNQGLKTVTISPFGERHSAWHWYANFNEIHNTGKGGLERADEISPVALKWIRDHGKEDNWFLHVNFWDPHTPYRTPDSFGDHFADTPLPAWLTEDVRQQHWLGVGPHSAQEITGYDDEGHGDWPKQPLAARSMKEVRQMFDGYDNGVRYSDEHIGRLFNALADQGVLDDTVIIISADHGENLGELNIYGDYQTADQITCRVPLIVKWPGITDRVSGFGVRGSGEEDGVARVDSALHYHFDFAATMIELLGGQMPEIWDAQPFTDAFRSASSPSPETRTPKPGRDFLVLSQGAWSCQRSVRFGDHLAIRSYHDGHHAFPDIMLFNLKDDPHEQHDLAAQPPALVQQAMTLLDQWHANMMRTATHPVDPMWIVMREGGPHHTCGYLPKYLQRLRATGRAQWADVLQTKHANECRL